MSSTQTQCMWWDAQGTFVECPTSTSRTHEEFQNWTGPPYIPMHNAKKGTRTIYDPVELLGSSSADPAAIIGSTIRVREPVAEKARRDASWDIDCGGSTSTTRCSYRGYAGYNG